MIWAGSDEGFLHVTRDGGKTWNNVTPRDLPACARISLIEASPYKPGTACLAANGYQRSTRAVVIHPGQRGDHAAVHARDCRRLGASLHAADRHAVHQPRRAIDSLLKNVAESIGIEILDGQGRVVNSYEGTAEKKEPTTDSNALQASGPKRPDPRDDLVLFILGQGSIEGQAHDAVADLFRDRAVTRSAAHSTADIGEVQRQVVEDR